MGLPIAHPNSFQPLEKVLQRWFNDAVQPYPEFLRGTTTIDGNNIYLIKMPAADFVIAKTVMNDDIPALVYKRIEILFEQLKRGSVKFMPGPKCHKILNF
jgi:hypothetical protein